MKNVKIGFIGGGNMGGAMIEALWRVQPDEVGVVRNSAEEGRKSSGGSEARGTENLAQTDKTPSLHECEKKTKFEIIACARNKNEALRQRFGIKIAASETDLAREADAIVLATKPASYEAILRLIAPDLAGKILLLLAPNFDIKRARQIVGEGVYIARVMPNIAACIGASATALCFDAGFSEAKKETVREIIAKIGKIYEIDETGFAAFTGIASSLPAYACAFIEAAADAGVRGGLPRQLCYDAVAAAVEGTARLIQSGKHPAALKDEVCSPAGTTIEGLAALEKGGFRGALMDAVAACIAKARG
ncbi:pyrroline-5-carboxylate reductase [Campylobacter concisus]|uniref:Pyrroline-5-carboxylate reductase n=1 Tax=Campylobacter concisus TaxID=199 RepID=A0AAE7TND1_9BACT|nr:pyrroline-5-carboxylate reductase [Campylobacter concisus]QPH85478.1 pyrroline-5-carboxylate reductase [Campylobacter concisus]